MDLFLCDLCHNPQATKQRGRMTLTTTEAIPYNASRYTYGYDVPRPPYIYQEHSETFDICIECANKIREGIPDINLGALSPSPKEDSEPSKVSPQTGRCICQPNAECVTDNEDTSARCLYCESLATTELCPQYGP